MTHPLSKATLLLAYHGSTEDAQPSRTGMLLASKLQACGVFKEVQAGFYKHPPYMNDLLQASKGGPVYILPMLMSSGYFAQQVFPKFLNIAEEGIRSFPHVQVSKEKTVVYGHPLGALDGMLDLICDTASELLQTSQTPSPLNLSDVSLALIGHGTARHTQSKGTAQDLAEKISQSHRCLEARAFFIEEAPFVRDILDWKTKSDHCVLVPFMAADGPHAIQDIPAALGQPEPSIATNQAKGEPTWQNPTTRQGKRIWITRPIGLSPLLPACIFQYLNDLANHHPPLAKDA